MNDQLKNIGCRRAAREQEERLDSGLNVTQIWHRAVCPEHGELTNWTRNLSEVTDALEAHRLDLGPATG